ncbi:hypothetical protein ASD04_00710 [Devosia sp. Root436]|uniref:hydantoinase/oxoprolinase family protein n=1 Tax=Devosia sp. Root436 TaxID=1736537 RepID=UPI0006FCF557|nr:hydantoinase/oxoprolinase family protein [Devosia sp. Root436]KQX42525.1 hypothetical protein ASD04_00710 [Devosia sp. Root436]
MRIGVEVGGTFTDLVALSPEGLRSLKVSSTPAMPEQGVLDALDALGGGEAGADTIVHGSTVATNALLERRGAPTILVVTEGFRDLLELQREVKTRNYDLRYRRTEPLVPRNRVVEIGGRIDAEGVEVEPFDKAAVRESLEAMLNQNPEATLAVCLLHSYRNATHERWVRDIALDLRPDLLVSLSSDVMPEFREYERASTTTMNAYLAPVVEGYLNRLDEHLRRRAFGGRFYIMQSNGGMLPAERSGSHAVRTVLSGPAAGVMGAVRMAALSGHNSIITLDMGGTSTDISLIDDATPTDTTSKLIDRLPILTPMLDIATIGAGGGSIAWIDDTGMLNVGPRSAGAQPGPACYGRGGTEPTLTDAFVVMGILRPNRFLGGRMALDVAAAERAVGSLGARLGLGLQRAAASILRVAVANMLHATREVSIERGYDPRDYVVAAFGGAGPLAATVLADELGANTVFVPSNPGVMSALGLLLSDFRRDYVATGMSDAAMLSAGAIRAALAGLEAEARTDIERMRPEGDARFHFSADLRYAGQGYELSVPIRLSDEDPARTMVDAFHELHQLRFGHSYPNARVRLVNYRLRLVVARPLPTDALRVARNRPDRQDQQGDIWIDGTKQPCTFLLRETLAAGVTAAGPVVVEEDSASTFVPAGWRLRIDEHGGMNIERQVAA